MGCCENKALLTPENLQAKLKQFIQSSNHTGLIQSIRYMKNKTLDFDVNSVEIKIDDTLKVSPLGYSLLLGLPDTFMLIYQQLEGSFDLMERNFAKFETTGLCIICLNNYVNLLNIYFPLLVEHENFNVQISLSSIHSNEVHTLPSIVSIKSTHKSSFSAVQLACDNGNLAVLNYFFNYKGNIPKSIANEVDLHYVDPETGFNCAMVACKNNDLTMIKFLHVHVKCDFFIINRFGENVLNVLALGSQKIPEGVFKCLKYLIEIIGVDPLFNYQETLILLHDHQSTKYIENILNSHDIKFDRRKLIEESQISFANQAKRIEIIQNRTGSKFNFSTIFPELYNSSVLSASKNSQGNISKLINGTETQNMK